MNIFSNFFYAIKNLFHKKNDIKYLEAPKVTIDNNQRNDFLDSLKVNLVKRNKVKVETIICPGDGLGFQKTHS